MNDTKELISIIDALLSAKERVIIAIDGRCASGKTTLASVLADKYMASVIHTDDFFLPPELRTAKRYAQPGGNLHFERFENEALAALQNGGEFSYRPFDCRLMDYGKSIKITPRPLAIIEGAYCLRPEYRLVYDLKVFMDISPDEQKARITRRNGESALKMFLERWIPLEEHYFTALGVRECCDCILSAYP